MHGHQRYLRLIFCSVFCLFVVLTGARAAEEIIEQRTEVSVSVVKADFSHTMWTVSLLERDLYAVKIRVPNTGSYDAQNVRVELSSLVDLRYISSTASMEHELLVDENRPRKIVQWIFPAIVIGEAAEIEATFESAQSLDQLSIHVAVESDVSAPVAVQTDVGTETSKGEESVAQDESGEPTLVDRVFAWFKRMVGNVAKLLNAHFERMLDWVYALFER